MKPRRSALLALVLLSLAPLAGAADGAEVKVGTGVIQMELQGEAKAFKVAAGDKIWVWTKVADLADRRIEIVFEKAGKAIFKQGLAIPRKAHRTYAYRTFRKGDGGTWMARVQGPEGQALGSVAFTVEVE